MPGSDLERLTATLRERYEQSWARVVTSEDQLLDDWAALNRTQRLSRLRDTRRTIEGLMDVADELALRWAARELPDAYQLGARQAAGAAGAAVSFTAVDVDAVNSLVFDARQSLLAASSYVKRSTKALINRLATDHMTDKLIRGLTAEQASRNLRHELEGHGVTAVVYADGSRHGLAEYADMAILTRTAEAYQVGGFHQTETLGIGWMELFDGSGCGLTSHDDPEKANGMILPLAQARLYPLAHPRCGRTSSPRPDIASKRDAEQARLSTTSEQRADQAAAEQARAASKAASAQRRRLQQQFGRRQDGILSDVGSRATPAQARQQIRLSRSSQRTKKAVAQLLEQQRAAVAGAASHRVVEDALARGLQAATGRPVRVRLARADLELARESAVEVLRLAEKYPAVVLRGFEAADIPTSGDPYAATGSVPGHGSRMLLSPGWYGDAFRLRVSLAEDAAAGFHPPGAGTPAAVVTHEFGHALHKGLLGDHWATDMLRDLQDLARRSGVDVTDDAAVRGWVGREVSHYAATDPDELVAEAFTEVELNGDRAREVSRFIVERMMAAYQQARKESVA